VSFGPIGPKKKTKRQPKSTFDTYPGRIFLVGGSGAVQRHQVEVDRGHLFVGFEIELPDDELLTPLEQVAQQGARVDVFRRGIIDS
jgi:hypothetical protein